MSDQRGNGEEGSIAMRTVDGFLHGDEAGLQRHVHRPQRVHGGNGKLCRVAGELGDRLQDVFNLADSPLLRGTHCGYDSHRLRDVLREVTELLDDGILKRYKP